MSDWLGQGLFALRLERPVALLVVLSVPLLQRTEFCLRAGEWWALADTTNLFRGPLGLAGIVAMWVLVAGVMGLGLG
jgi:hypothetical protein